MASKNETAASLDGKIGITGPSPSVPVNTVDSIYSSNRERPSIFIEADRRKRDEVSAITQNFRTTKSFGNNKEGSEQHPMGTKNDNDELDTTPGPAAYNVENTKRAVFPSSPAYTFGMRSRCSSFIDSPRFGTYSPGPGNYNVPLINDYKQRAPAYSLIGRSNMYKGAPFITQYKD